MTTIDDHPCFSFSLPAPYPQSDLTCTSKLDILQCTQLTAAIPGTLTKPSIFLSNPICIGDYRWSQVWLGGLCEKNEIITVVIKVFQLSKFPRGAIEHLAVNPAKREASAYYKMKSLQGDIIPLSHAFLQICIDDGEVAVAHVMEYIPAWTADTLNYKSSLKIDETSAQSLFDKLEQIHTCGVTHQGINLYNILIQPVEPLRFIFIDFGKAEEADESLKSKDKSNLAHLLARLKLRYTTLSTIFDEEDLAGIRKVPPPKSTVDVAELWRTTKPHFNWSAEPVWD